MKVVVQKVRARICQSQLPSRSWDRECACSIHNSVSLPWIPHKYKERKKQPVYCALLSHNIVSLHKLSIVGRRNLKLIICQNYLSHSWVNILVRTFVERYISLDAGCRMQLHKPMWLLCQPSPKNWVFGFFSLGLTLESGFGACWDRGLGTWTRAWQKFYNGTKHKTYANDFF